MRVLVAGATGVLGRATTSALVAAGHEVFGTARDAEGSARVERCGAVPAVIGDALEPGTLNDLVRETQPDAIVNQLSALPRDYAPRVIEPFYRRTSELRLEGTRAVVEAAAEQGDIRVVSQSVAFLYSPLGDRIKDETALTFGEAPEPLGHAIRAVLAMERLLEQATRVRGIALRYGFLYGPGTHYAFDGSIGRSVRRGEYPLIGDGEGVFSFVRLEDAAAATVAAVECDVRGVVNIVDDRPTPVREWLCEWANALQAAAPPELSVDTATRNVSSVATMMATQQRGASNALALSSLGWVPKHRFVDEITAAWADRYPMLGRHMEPTDATAVGLTTPSTR